MYDNVLDQRQALDTVQMPATHTMWYRWAYAKSSNLRALSWRSMQTSQVTVCDMMQSDRVKITTAASRCLDGSHCDKLALGSIPAGHHRVARRYSLVHSKNLVGKGFT